MNLFYFSDIPEECAKEYGDQHLSRIILQLGFALSSILQLNDFPQPSKYQIESLLQLKVRMGAEKFSRLYKPQPQSSLFPSVIWSRKSRRNFLYTIDLFNQCCLEYELRFNKRHKTDLRLCEIFDGDENNLIKYLQDFYCGAYGDQDFLFPAPQCVPEEFKVHTGKRFRFSRSEDQYIYQYTACIFAYRRYYYHQYAKNFTWTNREKPEWMKSGDFWDLMKILIDTEKNPGADPGYRARIARTFITENGEPIKIKKESTTMGIIRPQPTNITNDTLEDLFGPWTGG